jgi:hypothetical protein
MPFEFIIESSAILQILRHSRARAIPLPSMPRAFAAALGVKHSTLLGAFASAGVPVSSLRGDIPLVMLATLGAILAAQIISKLLLRPLRGARCVLSHTGPHTTAFAR